MKKLSLIVGLALVMLAASCSKDTTSDINPSVKTILGVSIDSPQSRTYIGEANGGVYPVLWSEGDKIVVNDQTVAIDPKFVGTSTIQVEVEVSPDYKLAYPAELVDGEIVTIPEVQKFVEGSFAVGSGLLAGYSVDQNVVLHNLHGYLKFVIANAADVKGVTVIANGGEAISGTYFLDYQYPYITPRAGKDIIRVTDVVATNGVATVVVAVPAAEYSQGFTVKVYDSNNGVMTKNLKGTGAEVKEGVIYNMPQLDFAPTATEALIMTAADLVDFVTLVNASSDYSKWVNADGEVKLGADIDLTGVTLPQIAVFAGKFNGQGFALKNWHSNLAFIGNLDTGGLLKNLVIDESCSVVPDLTSSNTHIGVIVGYSRGLVTGCVNNSDLKITGSVLDSGKRFGCIVASGYSYIENCINNGDIICDFTTVDEAIYIGGITGYYNPESGNGQGKEFLKDCINNGEIKVHSGDTPSKAYVAGILGSTALANQYETVDGKSQAKEVTCEGTILRCYNNGDVSYSYEQLGSGTYANVGGVVGYAQAIILDCENTGEVSYITPSQADTSATRPAVGGIVASTLFSVKNCTNYGDVNVAGTWSSAGTKGAQGTGGQVQPNFGGVAGSIGHYSISGSTVVENCVNYGILNFHPTILLTGGTHHYFGGVVGWTSGNVSNCSNHGHMIASSNAIYVYCGGVVGAALDNCITNNCVNVGDMSLNHDLTDCAKSGVASGSDNVKTFFAGIISYAQGAVYSCENSGTAVLHTNSRNASCGGIAGYASASASISNCTSEASATYYLNHIGNVLSDYTGSAPYHYIGGCVGYGKGNMDSVVSSENGGVTIYTNIAGDFGGVAGYIASNTSKLTNNAPLTVDFTYLGQTCGSAVMVGGVFAKNYCTSDTKISVSHCVNTAKMTIKNLAHTSGFSYIGGIMASNESGVGTIRDCENSGEINIDAPSTVRVGGVAAYTPCDLLNSSFTGKIIARNLKYFSETRQAAVGGLIGYTAQGITGGSVDCVIDAQGEAGIAVGGVMGTSGNDTWTGLTVKADLTASVDASLGLLLGGKVATSNVTVTVGSTAAPVKISKQSKINGVAIRADGNDPLSGMPASAIVKVSKIEYID